MKKFNLVYKITNKINGKIYVGVHSTDIVNDSYMGSGSHIKNAIKKYGVENFEKSIIKFCDSESEAYELEKTIVTPEFILLHNVYNLREGGDRYNGGRFLWTDEQKENLKESHPRDGKNNPMYGKGHLISGKKNGRHKENYTGDITELSKKISNSLKNTDKNKKGRNPASKKYYVYYEPLNLYMDIDKGYLYKFCEVFNIKYTTIYNTLKTKKPILNSSRLTLKTSAGYQLFEGTYEETNK